MKKLEIKVRKAIEENRPKESDVKISDTYEGFRVVEDIAYNGPTSIRYWM